MSFQIGYKSRLGKIGPNVRRRLAQVVAKTAFDAEGAAKTGAPVDTGALRNSIYSATAQGSGYGPAAGAAQEARVAAQDQPLELHPEARPKQDLEAIVAVGAEYGLPVEADHPYLGPAIDGVAGPFLAACKRAVREGAEQ
jgi:hypothetical protein